MAGASFETTLELWVSSLRDVKARMRGLFTQERVAASAGLFLDGLLGDEQRKTGWMRAEAAGDPGPWRRARRSLAVAGGTLTRFATSCASICSRGAKGPSGRGAVCLWDEPSIEIQI
jgi:hypothetical protein